MADESDLMRTHSELAVEILREVLLSCIFILIFLRNCMRLFVF